MDKLVGRLVARLGADRPMAAKAVAINLDVLIAHAGEKAGRDKAGEIVCAIPGPDHFT